MNKTDIFRLADKRVLITGASGGLGCHFAEVAAFAGADVILSARRVEALEPARRRAQRAGVNVTCVAMDVANEQSVHAAFECMPPPDVVINNAGISVQASTLELSAPDWSRVVDTNLKGPWLVAREAIRRWLAAERPGNIVNVASILGLRVQGQLAAYSASKAALIQLTRSIALDYAERRIRANALCPGYFSTSLNREWLATESGERMRKRIPFRRPGELHELDGPLLLLASDASSYMSGTTLVVDGAHLQSGL